MYVWIVALIGLLAILLCVVQETEGFTTVNMNAAKAQRQELQYEGERRYNHFARLQGTNTSLDPDMVDAALQQEIPVSTTNTDSLQSLLGYVNLGSHALPSNVGFGVEQTGSVQAKINLCESMSTVDCNSLGSDPRYAECGFCHRDGTSSTGKPHRGGMYISSDDQIRANQVADAKGTPAAYQPTIGTCKAKDFTVLKENCSALENQIQCQTAGAATASNPCGQCFGSAPPGTSGLLYVGPKPQNYTATLWVSHPGMHSSNGAGITVQYPNGSVAKLAPSTTPFLDPQQMTITVKEGDSLNITVHGIPPVWCGWLSNASGTRTVSLDIGEQTITPTNGFAIAGDKRSGVVNKVLSSSPKWSSWKATVPNTVLWYMRRTEVVPGAIISAWYGAAPASAPNSRGKDVTNVLQTMATYGRDVPINNTTFMGDPAPGAQKHVWIQKDKGSVIIMPEGMKIKSSSIENKMQMNFTVPATLTDPMYSNDKANCPSGPLVFTEAGMGMMGASACFKADGSFSGNMSCLQELWASAGGNANGTGYPSSDAKAKDLLVNDGSGKPALDATVERFNNGVNIALYGVDLNGSPQDFQVIKDNALFYLGIAMNNPCDGPSSATGPHTPECLDYLWKTSKNPGQDGILSDPSKLPYAYCSPKGGQAPLGTNGVNYTNVEAANELGGVSNVRASYQNIFNRSQDSSNFDAQADAMRSCYGISIQAPPDKPCPAKYRKYPNADRGGADIACYFDGSSADFCKQKCDADPNCKSYNYIYPNTVWGAQSGCCYKSTNTPILPQPGIDFYSKLAAGEPSVPEECTPNGEYLGRPSSDGGIRLYTQQECNSLNGNWHQNGECTKKSGGSYSDQCKVLNSLSSSSECAPTGVNLGRPGNGLRLYTQDECNLMNGNWHQNGECTKKSGGSYSYDCRNVN